MPKVTTVKAARKAYPNAGINVGDTYYYWEFRTGGVIRSKTYPRQSQLTQSEFLSTVYALVEGLEHLSADSFITEEDGKISIDHSGIESQIEDLVGELETLRDETQDKHDNMPDSLQQGPTGELLENRVSSIDEMIDTLQGIDLSGAENFDEEEEETEEPVLSEEPLVVEGVAVSSSAVIDASITKKFEARRERATEIVQAIIDEITALSYDGE